MKQDSILKYSESKKGEKNPNWKGGRMIFKSGHIAVLKPDHPYCNNRGYIMEHRLIMEQHIGRYLTKYEHVHHIDHNPKNNNIENLLLLSSSDHAFLHNEEYRLKNVTSRKCVECNIDQSRKWLKSKNGYKCKNCYERLRRRNKKLKIEEVE